VPEQLLVPGFTGATTETSGASTVAGATAETSGASAAASATTNTSVASTVAGATTELRPELVLPARRYDQN
jgi:hypothetical protein